MSSTLESLHMYVSDATVFRANSRNPWSNVLSFGWETLETMTFLRDFVSYAPWSHRSVASDACIAPGATT